MEGKMRISVVATGIDQQQFRKKPEEESNSTRNFSQRPLAAPKPAFAFPPRTVAPAAVVERAPAVLQELEEEEEMILVASAMEPTAAVMEQGQGKLLFSEARDAVAPARGRHSPTRLEMSTAPQSVRSVEPRFASTVSETQPAEPAFKGTRSMDPRGAKIRTTRESQPALWQEQQDAAEREASEPGFLQRMTARFSPREEQQPIRRTEVTASRAAPAASEGADYLEIPAFLRRQAN
jgi:hypothetical protein